MESPEEVSARHAAIEQVIADLKYRFDTPSNSLRTLLVVWVGEDEKHWSGGYATPADAMRCVALLEELKYRILRLHELTGGDSLAPIGPEVRDAITTAIRGGVLRSVPAAGEDGDRDDGPAAG